MTTLDQVPAIIKKQLNTNREIVNIFSNAKLTTYYGIKSICDVNYDSYSKEICLGCLNDPAFRENHNHKDFRYNGGSFYMVELILNMDDVEPNKENFIEQHRLYKVFHKGCEEFRLMWLHQFGGEIHQQGVQEYWEFTTEDENIWLGQFFNFVDWVENYLKELQQAKEAVGHLMKWFTKLVATATELSDTQTKILKSIKGYEDRGMKVPALYPYDF